MARALWTVALDTCEIRPEPLPACGPSQARVRTIVSAISGGTESLVFAGKIPPSEFERMRAPHQSGDFPFPVKYGYAAVGRVEDGPPEWIGRRVFVLHPHQDWFVVPVAALTPLPDTIPSERCALTANLETALNAVWDAGVGPGDKVAVIGAGVVGALVAAIVSRLPAVDLTLIDIDPDKRATAATFGADFTLLSDIARLPADFDCIFNASGHGDGLVAGLAIAGFEAKIVELSWYGSQTAMLPLGAGFHSRRLQIISSQVGQISASRRPRVDYARRMAVVARLMDDARLDTLIGDQIAFEEAPARFGDVLARRSGRASLIRYPTGD
jgi:threonine dehydrogenase-like Zn-dependent dehydrogenase